MKKYIIALCLSFLIICGCNPPEQKRDIPPYQSVQVGLDYVNYTIITIDEQEYIVFDGTHSMFVIKKNNIL